MVVDLLLKQQVLMANKGKIKIKRPKKWLYPRTAERIYERQLIAINKVFWDKVVENIISNLPMLVASAKSLRPDSNEKRLDAWSDQLKELTDKTYLDFSKAVSQPQITAVSLEQADRINNMNKNEFVKVIHSSVSVNPIVQENWLQPQMKGFVSQNVDLITNLGQDQKKRLEQNLYQNLSSGNGIDKIKDDLLKSENFGKNRSRLIARDQTNKFNGQLTQLRQQEIGIGSYIWSTSKDERVRPTHAAMEGSVVAWNDPPSIGHPGSEINCRCIAQPIITDAMFGDEPLLGLPAPEEKFIIEPVKEVIPEIDVSKYTVKGQYAAINYSEKLNSTDIAGLKEYQSGSYDGKAGGYANIQSYLRSGKPVGGETLKDVPEYIKKIDEAIKKGALTSKTITYRGIRKDFAAKYINMDVGQTFSDTGYFSTSTEQFIAENFANPDPFVKQLPVIMKVTGKKGSNAIFMPDVSDDGIESEVLFGRDQKFKITKKTKIASAATGNPYWEIEVESVVEDVAKQTPKIIAEQTAVISAKDYDIKSKFSSIKYSSDLAEDEVDAVKQYQGAKLKGNDSGGFTNIQAYLRTGKPNMENLDVNKIKKVIEDLDSAISKGAFVKNEIVYRGVKNGNAFVQMDIGSTFTEKGYFSTAKNIGTANKFSPVENRDVYPVVFKVSAKQGQKALFTNDYSTAYKEGEIIFPRNQQFKIISKKQLDAYKWEIEIEPI